MPKSKLPRRRQRSLADIRFEIAKLELRAGDTLVVRVPHKLLMADSKAIADAIVRNQLLPPGAKYLIVDSRVDLSVMRAAAITAQDGALVR